MNTTININIGGIAFNIDSDAYDLLNSYLKSIERNLSDDTDKAEVMRDIEARIAELFSDLCRTQHTQVVASDMVRAVMQQLGTPEDFKDNEKQDNGNRFDSMFRKKLYRDPDNKLIGGVCAGLGYWLGIDTLWVRLIFLLCLLLWGITLPIYLILWAIMPQALTAAQRLDMRGELATVENIQQEISQQRNTTQNNSGCLLTMLKIIVFGIGGFFLLIAAIVFISVITALIGAFSGLAALSPLGALSAFFSADYIWATILTILIIIVVCLPLFVLVASLIKYARGEKTTSRSLWTAFLIWVLALLGSITIGIRELEDNEHLWEQLITNGWYIDNDDDDISVGAAALAPFAVGEFHSVVVEGAADIRLTQADECYMEADSNRIKNAEVKDGTLYITTNKKGANIWLQTRELRSLHLSGAAKCKTPEKITAENLKITAQGASEIDITILASSLDINAEGASDIELDGTAQLFTLKVEGASKVDAEDFITERATVEAAGASKVKLNVTDHLQARSSGMSKITYKGDPTVESHNNGGGKIRKAE